MEARAIKRPFDDRIVAQLRRSLYGASDGLRDVPEMLRSVIEHGLWRERVVEETGELVSFERFEDFVTTPPLEGLGSSLKQLRNICQEDRTALDWLDRATVGGHGGDRKSQDIKSHNITLEEVPKARTGTSNTYALRKLRKDRPDLHQRVLADEISPHAAMVEAGFRKKTLTVPAGIDAAARVLIKHFDPDELYGAMIEARLR